VSFILITPTDVRNIAPEYKFPTQYPDTEIQLHINNAYLSLAHESWLNEYTETDTWNLAATYLAAHFIAVSHPEASQANRIRAWEAQGGNVTDDTFLGITRFGAVFKQMRTATLHCRMPVISAG
jgi:hypothetical protein